MYVSPRLIAPPTAAISLFPHPPSLSLALCAVVPVRNEAACLVRTLDALRCQCDPAGIPLEPGTYEVLLLANNCTDDTYQIARDYQDAYPYFALQIAEIRLPADKAHIGTVRRMLMDEACDRFGWLEKGRGIIASTDGDTEVDSGWVYRIIEEIGKGNDAVGGKIIVEGRDGEPDAYHSLDETYKTLSAQVESILDPLEHDPWPRHFQYFGASLAVTCEMYRCAGRLPQLPHLEDEAFHKALFCRDARIRRSLAVKVVTSGRQEGRVSIGLSEQLRKWAQMERMLEPQLVAGAREIVARFTYRHLVRTCWNDAHQWGRYDADMLASVAHEFSIAPHWLQHELEKNRYFGTLWENIECRMQAGGWYRKWHPVLIRKAIQDLTEFIRFYR